MKQDVKISKLSLGRLEFQIDLGQETGAPRAHTKCITTLG